MMPPIAVLAGGLATRMRPLTERVPKALLDVAGKPFAHLQLELLSRSGITDVVFCVGYLGEQIEDVVGDGSRWSVRVRYSHDGPTKLGTGGALRRALPLLGEAFFVTYGDAYLDCDYRSVWQRFMDCGTDGLMTVFQNGDRWGESNVEMYDGTIVCYDKRNRTSRMQHIDYGVGVLRERAIASYPEGEELDLAEVYADLLARRQLASFEVPTRFYEIGTPEGLAALDEHIRQANRGDL